MKYGSRYVLDFVSTSLVIMSDEAGPSTSLGKRGRADEGSHSPNGAANGGSNGAELEMPPADMDDSDEEIGPMPTAAAEGSTSVRKKKKRAGKLFSHLCDHS